MSEPNKPEDREQAVKAWEQQVNRPFMADPAKRRTVGVGVAVIAIAAIGLVWALTHGGSETARPSADDGIKIAERQPVPELKEPQAASVPAVSSTPASAPAAPTPNQASSADDAARAQREAAEAQRRAAENRMLEARMKSAILAPNSGQGGSAAMAAAGSDSGSTGSLQGSGDRGAQDPNSRYARAVSGGGVTVSKAGRLTDLEYKILPGKLIEATLQPRAISDLPNTVCATVQRNVYGEHGRIPLIPWGSRMCGVYSSELRKGQDRLFVVWNMVWLPDGQHVAIDSPGGDQLGSAGMGGRVDTHFAQIFGMSALISIIGAGASNVGVSSGAQNNAGSYYREAVTQAAANSAQTVLQPYANIPPTVTVDPGARVTVYVNRVLDFTDNYHDDIEAAKGDGVTYIQ